MIDSIKKDVWMMVDSLTSGFQLSSNQSYLLFILILPPLCVV